jgi:gluconokinase
LTRSNDVVVMGVSGSGKSTIGRLIAQRLGGTFIDADDLHSAAARSKMSTGVPLSDEDRWPWLDALAARIAEQPAENGPAVVACSALRLSYRDRLRTGADKPLAFVHLHGDEDLLELRMTRRSDHFMPTALLPSQLETLEPLSRDELGAVFDIVHEPDAVASAAAAWIAGLDANSS